MIKVTVIREQWLRGEGPQKSFLLREEDGKMCCLGFYCEAMGIPKVLFSGRKTLLQVQSRVKIGDAMGTFWDLMILNDIFDNKDFDREAKIIELGAKIGIEFTFVNQDQVTQT